MLLARCRHASARFLGGTPVPVSTRSPGILRNATLPLADELTNTAVAAVVTGRPCPEPVLRLDASWPHALPGTRDLRKLNMREDGTHFVRDCDGPCTRPSSPCGSSRPGPPCGSRLTAPGHAGGLNASGPRLAAMMRYVYRWLPPADVPAPQLLAGVCREATRPPTTVASVRRLLAEAGGSAAECVIRGCS